MSTPNDDSSKNLSFQYIQNSQTFQYIKNTHGRDQLIDSDGFLYNYHHGRNNLDGSRVNYWKCSQPDVCRAMIVLKDGKMIHSVKHTNHKNFENPHRLLARTAEISAIKKSEDLSVQPMEILTELEQLPQEIKLCLSCSTKILGRIYKRRALIRKNGA